MGSMPGLDVEQIGHCYEGLLDHSCIPIDELALGLVGPDGNEPELTVADLKQFGDDTDVLCEWLSDKTRCNKKASALAKLLDEEPEGVDLARLRVACGHDDDTVERVRPYWGLIRPDLRGLPVVLLPGSMFVTQTSTRRNMGAQYTTKALAEEVVQYALEPLVYDPGPQNEPDQTKWKLKTPAAILDLRVCDPAVGSGAILTAAGRYLADRLIESVLEYGPGEGAFASRLHDLASAPAEEQTVLARREVVDHCLYGVDKNPVAAEMAKLSLWLTTMARERPFTFLDHAIQVGDSLLGITDIDQLRWMHLDPSQRQGQRGFESLALDLRLKEAVELAQRLRGMSVVTVRDADEKQRLSRDLTSGLSSLILIADAVVGAALSVADRGSSSFVSLLDSQMESIHSVQDGDDRAMVSLRSAVTSWLRADLPDEPPKPWDRRCLHWPLAFPEVFLTGRNGFDAFVGNPPFLGGTRISGAMGSAYREFIARYVAGTTPDKADLVAFFFARVDRLIGEGGCLGLLAVDSIAEGDARAVGLECHIASGRVIHRAVRSCPWPGAINVPISKVWISGVEWVGPRTLDSVTVTDVGTDLREADGSSSEVHSLVRNSSISFEGVKPAGMGFVLEPPEAEALRSEYPEERAVLVPYLNGDDVNSHPQQSPSRWIIDFGRRSLPEAEEFPKALEIVRQRVKPQRDKANRKAHRERWWIHGEVRPGLRAAIDGLDKVTVLTKASGTLQPAYVSTGPVFSEKLVVFASPSLGLFAFLSSGFHYWWASTRIAGFTQSYSPKRCFETIPLPDMIETLTVSGERLELARRAALDGGEVGLTELYGRLHRPEVDDTHIETLREVHASVDAAVRDAYGWSDVELNHHHWETPQGVRFTIGPEAKDEILDRLLELNHERYAEEVAAGLHDKKATKSTKKRAAKKASTDQGQMEL